MLDDAEQVVAEVIGLLDQAKDLPHQVGMRFVGGGLHLAVHAETEIGHCADSRAGAAGGGRSGDP